MLGHVVLKLGEVTAREIEKRNVIFIFFKRNIVQVGFTVQLPLL